MELKHNIRKYFLKKRSQISSSIYTNLNNSILEKTHNIIQSILNNKNYSLPNNYMGNSVVGLYWPIRKEINLLSLVSVLNVAIPKINGNNMFYMIYDKTVKLEQTRFNSIMQPKEGDVVKPSILVIPAIALSLQGDRVGFGKGYYDRYITKANNPVKIGVVFHQALLEFLPKEPHDLTLDYVITEKIIIKI